MIRLTLAALAAFVLSCAASAQLVDCEGCNPSGDVQGVPLSAGSTVTGVEDALDSTGNDIGDMMLEAKMLSLAGACLPNPYIGECYVDAGCTTKVDLVFSVDYDVPFGPLPPPDVHLRAGWKLTKVRIYDGPTMLDEVGVSEAGEASWQVNEMTWCGDANTLRFEFEHTSFVQSIPLPPVAVETSTTSMFVTVECSKCLEDTAPLAGLSFVKARSLTFPGTDFADLTGVRI